MIITDHDGTQKEVLDILDRDRKAFMRAALRLRDVLKRIKEYQPEANFYLEGMGNLYLLAGPSHAGHSCKRCDENAVEHVNIGDAGGGGW